MKKRLILKSWVSNLLITINLIVIMFMGNECDDLKIFLLSKIILMSIFLLNNLILAKYSKLFEED